MIRTVLTSTHNIISFPIPEKYIGRQLEVIAFAVDEPQNEILYASKGDKTFLAVELKSQGFTFDRNQANER